MIYIIDGIQINIIHVKYIICFTMYIIKQVCIIESVDSISRDGIST